MNVLGPRVRVRHTRHEDLPFLQALWNDGAVMRFFGYPHGMQVTEAGMDKWWAMTPQARHSGERLSIISTPHCTIELLDATPIGEFSYTLDAHQRGRLDIKLAPEFWGQGLATETMTRVMRELFAVTPVTHLIVEPTTENNPAQKLCQRCGFHPAPTGNHPQRWECARSDFAHSRSVPIAAGAA